MAAGSVKLEGDRKLLRKLNDLKTSVQKKLLRRAVNKGSTPILKTIKKNAPRRTGFMKKAMARKVRTYKSGAVVAVMGPKREAVGTYNDRKYVPANVAHLVEGGHGGKRPAPPHPFVKPSFESTKEESINIVSSDLAAGIEQEARKP